MSFEPSHAFSFPGSRIACRCALAFALVACAVFFPAQIFAQQGTPFSQGEVKFVIKDFRATSDRKVGQVFESAKQFEMLGNPLTIQAHISAQIPANETWRVGVIQEIDSIDIRAVYSHSTYRWKLPKLPYCDSSPSLAKKGEPWFSLAFTTRSAVGSKNYLVDAKDNPAIGCPWTANSPGKAESFRVSNDLREVYKEYRFTDWLAAERGSDHKLVLLARFRWHFLAHARLDPGQPIGRRAKVIPHAIEEPVVGQPVSGDLETLSRTGVISGMQCGNRDQKLVIEPGPE